MRKLIKNDVVKMDWDADTFFESRDYGFIAAVNVYETPKGSVPVIFQDNKIYLLYDAEEGDLASLDDIKSVIKDCFDTGDDVEDRYYASYIELGIATVDNEDIANSYGLTDEDISDINQRIMDLSPYWEIEETPMFD